MITVIPTTAIGAGKLTISAASWSSAAPTAPIMTAAAAHARARRAMSRARAHKRARPVSHAALAFPLMTMTAIASPRLPA